MDEQGHYIVSQADDPKWAINLDTSWREAEIPLMSNACDISSDSSEGYKNKCHNSKLTYCHLLAIPPFCYVLQLHAKG